MLKYLKHFDLLGYAMQTVTLEVQDSFVPNLLSYLKQFKNEVKVCNDKNLEHDPYFYERQKELIQIREDIKKDPSRLISFDEFELKYAN